MTLHWMVHSCTLSELGYNYGVGKSTAVKIVHDTVAELKKKMAQKSIRFPEGKQLKMVMNKLQVLS